MENAEEGNIEYKYKDISYDALLQQCNQGDVLKEKQQIAQIAHRMAESLCKMNYYTNGLCGHFAGIKTLLTNPDFIYACVSKNCQEGRKKFKEMMYQEMFKCKAVKDSSHKIDTDKKKS